MKRTEYTLVSLIEMHDSKLDKNALRKALIGNDGKGTEVWKKFKFNTLNSDFDERNNAQIYDLSYEIWLGLPIKYKYVFGQRGLFLKIDKSASYETVINAITNAKDFVDFCKAFLFKPVAIAHIGDGDYYMSYKEYQKNSHLFGSVDIIESEVEK